MSAVTGSTSRTSNHDVNCVPTGEVARARLGVALTTMTVFFCPFGHPFLLRGSRPPKYTTLLNVVADLCFSPHGSTVSQ